MNSSDYDDDILDEQSGLSAQAMLNAAPSHHGTVLKLHVPFVYAVLPAFAQGWVSNTTKSRRAYVLSYLITPPQWKEREMVLCGSFLYRFRHALSKAPKGTPVDMKAVSANLVRDDDDQVDAAVLDNLPPGVDCVFTVVSLGKRRHFAVASRQDAVAWVNAVRDGRQEVITRSMGHSKVPLPSSWSHFDRQAARLIQRRERVKRRSQESETRDLQMSGGGYGRGIY